MIEEAKNKKKVKQMKKLLATMAIAAVAAWATPASAGVLFEDAGATIGNGNGTSFTTAHFDLTGFLNVKLIFKTDGIGGNDECDGSVDCFSVTFNPTVAPATINPPLMEGTGVPRSLASHGPILLGDNPMGTLTFASTFSASREGIEISGIQLKNKIVSEPAPLALFGLGLAALGYVRRKQSA